ncbi:hypothetical protein TNCV_4052951 [Trichonephila clavipes]|nr:hypothetical protein TNCV_4052951 [Trichonephila clavipes]
MAAVDFLHHENPATGIGVETATLGIQGQRQTNYAPASKECTRKIRAPRTAPGNIFSGEESQWGLTAPIPWPPVSRRTGETPFLSRAMEEGCSCTAFPSKFYGLPYPEKLPECLKTDHRFLSGATDYTRESISGGPVVEGPPFGWFRKRLLDSFWQQASSSNVNQGQVTKPAPPLLTSTPHQWEKARALDRFNVHRSPTGWVFSGLELMTRRQRFRYLDH